MGKGRPSGDQSPAGDRKPPPGSYKVKVEQVKFDNSFEVRLSDRKVRDLRLVVDKPVLLKGKKKSNTVCNVKRNSQEYGVIQMNEITRQNLRAKAGDEIEICEVDIPAGVSVCLALFDDSVPAATGDVIDNYARCYFDEQSAIPVHVDDTFSVLKPGENPVQFQIVNVTPPPFCTVQSTTKLTLSDRKVKRLEYLRYIKAAGYDDIGGYKKEIAQMREVIEIPLTYPELFVNIGIKPPKGVLLHGPPGTGKTLMARAASNESGAKFFLINGPEILSSFYGESEANVRRIFYFANQMAPSIIFIDEIDSIATCRDKLGCQLDKRIVAQLLTSMDGMLENSRVMVLAATNRPDSLDPAIRRAGRFDREIEIGVPSESDRLEILRIVTKDMKIARDVDLEYIARETHGFVGADLSLLCTEAAMKQISEKFVNIDGNIDDHLRSMTITMDNFRHAMNKVSPSALKDVMVETPNVQWSDIGGLDKVKKELQELVQYPITYPHKFSQFGLEPSTGVLFYGPPGCGKTMLAKTVCAESKANFISVKGPELLSRWFGESCFNVRQIFTKAKRAAPCILFFDEMDSLAKVRGNTCDTPAADRVANQLLTEMDGMTKNKNVFIVGATNRPDIVDPAFLRPGRLDQLIYIPLPDEKSRYAILSAKLRRSPLAKDVDLNNLAKRTQGFSGADLGELCQRACKFAIRQSIAADQAKRLSTKKPTFEASVAEITRNHFEEALENCRRSVSDDEIKRYDEFAEKFRKSGNGYKGGNGTSKSNIYYT